jgi:hypothetical protein
MPYMDLRSLVMQVALNHATCGNDQTTISSQCGGERHAIDAEANMRTITTLTAVSAVILGGYLVSMLLSSSFTSSSQSRRPSGVPNKFDDHGRVQQFAGNTIICPLAEGSSLYQRLLPLIEELRQHELSRLYTLLPPSSWHMTLFEGVVDQRRGPGQWPKDLDVNATLEKCTSHFKEKLSTFDVNTPLPIRVTPAAIEFPRSLSGIRVRLEPHNEEALRDLRNRLSDLLQIRGKKHDVYGFHLSLAYMINFPTRRQEEQLLEVFLKHFEMIPKTATLEWPAFCEFDDMFAYRPVLNLSNSVTQSSGSF